MLRSLSAPNILCAFDSPLGSIRAFATFLSFSFVAGAACFRPGTGKENFEVRPIASERSKPQAGGFN